MQNKKTTKAIASAMSLAKVNKYLSSGQVKELEDLKKYKSTHHKIVWECQDNWYL